MRKDKVNRGVMESIIYLYSTGQAFEIIGIHLNISMILSYNNNKLTCKVPQI